MPALRWSFCWVLLVAFGALGCKRKITQPQCEQLLDHFAEVVVRERLTDAGAEDIASERTRERREAARSDEFKNCTSEVQVEEHACAMRALSSDAILKCLD